MESDNKVQNESVDPEALAEMPPAEPEISPETTTGDGFRPEADSATSDVTYILRVDSNKAARLMERLQRRPFQEVEGLIQMLSAQMQNMPRDGMPHHLQFKLATLEYMYQVLIQSPFNEVADLVDSLREAVNKGATDVD